ncbi:MAG TPA: hypothetical protein VNV44_03275 [Solirubrobacteraceae bacterium]|jgi:hypothetical protein|nr:hypothetical protein [Solirubrobacteraceae bacterium]
MEPSWRRKIDRAEHHLRDFESRVAPLRERRGYPVSEGFEAEGQERLWVCRVEIPEPDDPLLPIIAGDLMFNLRSALDHLAHAMVRRATWQTAFPVFTVDPNERDATTGDYLHPEDRDRWHGITKGFPKRAMPIVERVQPYHFKRHGRDPRYGALALLRAFQNADKHRRLAFIVSGLENPVMWYWTGLVTKKRVPYERIPEDGRLPPSTVVYRGSQPLPPHMHMEAEGVLDVMIGDGTSREYYSCPGIFEGMVRDVRGILDRLEPYATHLPPPPRR